MFGRSWLRATLTALVMIGVALSVGAVQGLAHAEPVTTNPPIDGSVEMAPPALEIVFSQEVTDGTMIEVFGPDGRPVHAATAEIDLNDPDRTRVTVALYGNLPAGVYTVNWTAVSAEDDHAESGSYTFTVTTGSATTVIASPEATPAASPEASPAASPVAGAAALSAKEQANLIADEAQRQATQQAMQEDNVDEGDLGLAVLPGIAAGIGIYLFWRRVRPKPEERVSG
jgi:methionine-rich copper-binding protein CopC